MDMAHILQYLVDAPARDGKKIKEKQIEKVKSRRNLTNQEIIVTLLKGKKRKRCM